jgi:hypothetical protein
MPIKLMAFKRKAGLEIAENSVDPLELVDILEHASCHHLLMMAEPAFRE